MKFVLAMALVLGVSFSAFAGYPVVPDQGKTPGALCSKGDRDFNGYRYGEHIPYCQRSVSRGLKRNIYDSYQIPNACRNRYTVDHFYPLSMGGNNSSKNLWPEHRLVKELRFDLEQETFDRLREGHLSQREALEIIREAKLNPPVHKIADAIKTFGRGDDCDSAALTQLQLMIEKRQRLQ